MLPRRARLLPRDRSSARRYRAGGDRRGSSYRTTTRYSVRGTLRGLHAQNPNAQGKLLRVIAGEVFDVAVDARRGSPDATVARSPPLLSADNFQQIYVPPGLLHGFVVTSDAAQVEYKCTAYYRPDAELVRRVERPRPRDPVARSPTRSCRQRTRCCRGCAMASGPAARLSAEALKSSSTSSSSLLSFLAMMPGAPQHEQKNSSPGLLVARRAACRPGRSGRSALLRHSPMDRISAAARLSRVRRRRRERLEPSRRSPAARAPRARRPASSSSASASGQSSDQRDALAAGRARAAAFESASASVASRVTTDASRARRERLPGARIDHVPVAPSRDLAPLAERARTPRARGRAACSTPAKPPSGPRASSRQPVLRRAGARSPRCCSDRSSRARRRHAGAESCARTRSIAPALRDYRRDRPRCLRRVTALRDRCRAANRRAGRGRRARARARSQRGSGSASRAAASLPERDERSDR